MGSEFFSNDTERWDAISNLKYDVAKYLKFKPNSKILDVLVGYADFSRAIAKIHNVNVTAIEITDEDIEGAIERIEKEKLHNKVEIIRMNATDMEFPDEYFDYVVNFIGWEDLTAVSGEEGVEKVFSEIARVLKKDGHLIITFSPEIAVIDKISKKDKELDEYMWLSKKRRMYFSESFFKNLFKKYKFKVIDRKSFQTEKRRVTPKDAKDLLKWSYENYESFYARDVKMRSDKEIIEKFGEFINNYGTLVRESHVILLIGKKF